MSPRDLERIRALARIRWRRNSAGANLRRKARKAAGIPVKARAGSKIHHPLYVTWEGMRGRCLHKSCSAFRFYGARGISICPQWANDFWQFVRDMGPRPEGTSIDRIDNNGNYEPGNCRWATIQEQAVNKRQTSIDLKGQVFGRYTVLERTTNRKWLCRCSCGNTKAVRGSHLKRGLIKSCGCWRKEATKAYFVARRASLERRA